MKYKVNQQWFNARLASVGKSQSSFATIIKLDKASFSRTLKGDRKLQIDEAITISNLFGVPLYEVLVNFGYAVNTSQEQAQKKLEDENKKLSILVSALVAQIGGAHD